MVFRKVPFKTSGMSFLSLDGPKVAPLQKGLEEGGSQPKIHLRWIRCRSCGGERVVWISPDEAYVATAAMT